MIRNAVLPSVLVKREKRIIGVAHPDLRIECETLLVRRGQCDVIQLRLRYLLGHAAPVYRQDGITACATRPAASCGPLRARIMPTNIPAKIVRVIGDVVTVEIFDDAGTGKRIQRANVSANECGSTAMNCAGDETAARQPMSANSGQ